MPWGRMTPQILCSGILLVFCPKPLQKLSLFPWNPYFQVVPSGKFWLPMKSFVLLSTFCSEEESIYYFFKHLRTHFLYSLKQEKNVLTDFWSPLQKICGQDEVKKSMYSCTFSYCGHIFFVGDSKNRSKHFFSCFNA